MIIVFQIYMVKCILGYVNVKINVNYASKYYEIKKKLEITILHQVNISTKDFVNTAALSTNQNSII